MDVPFLPAPLVSFLAARLRNVPALVTQSLLDSLHYDTICHEEDIRVRSAAVRI